MKIKKIISEVKHELDVLMGNETKDKCFSSDHAFPDVSAASEAFARSVDKLLDVNAWTNLPGINSEFRLYDSAGRPKTGSAEVGDFIRIDIPGPTPENWVKVIDRRSEEKLAEFTVKPCADPAENDESVQGEIEHFFGEEARSTFRVQQTDNRLVAYEIGQNESINNQGGEAGDRAVANTLIAEGGWLFFQKMQWKKLTDYLVHL